MLEGLRVRSSIPLPRLTLKGLVKRSSGTSLLHMLKVVARSVQ
jgi:hypothetical protein